MPNHGKSAPSLEVTLSLVAGAVLLAFTFGRLGVTASEAIRSAALLLLAFVPLGWMVTSGLDAIGLSRGERSLLALLAGYPIASTLYYLLSLAGGEQAYFLVVAGVFGAWVWRRPRHRRASAAVLDPVSSAPPILLAVAPLMLLVATRFCRAFIPTEAGLVYPHSSDHSLHLSIYWELLRGFPPSEVPTAAGVAFPTYHFLAFMPGLLLIKTGGLDVITVYHALLPLMKVSLLMGAIYLAVRVRTGSGRTATATLPALFLVAASFERVWNDAFVVGPSPYYDLLRNEAEGGGLIVWATIACLLTLHDRARSLSGTGAGSPLLLASLFAGLSYGFKAQLFLLFGAAFCGSLLWVWWKERSKLPFEAWAIMTSAFALIFAVSRTPGAFAAPRWTPGLFAELHIYPHLAPGALRDFFLSFPTQPGFLIAVALALWRIVAFSPLVPLYLARSARRPRALGLADSWLVLAFLLALPMGYGFSVLTINKEPSPFEFRQAAHGLALAGVVISVIALHEVAHRLRANPGRVVPVAIGLASLAATPFLFGEEAFIPAQSRIVVSADEQCALLFLREKTAPTSVVARARSGPNHAVIAGFAGRRAVLEYYGRQIDWNRDREKDLQRLFATGNRERAEEVLRTNGVDYVVESRKQPLNFVTDALKPVFESGDFRVYRSSLGRIGEADPTGAVPEFFRRRKDLACPALPPAPTSSPPSPAPRASSDTSPRPPRSSS